MEDPPWRSDTDLDADGLARILSRERPALRPVTATYLDEGWDFLAFLVNGEWVFRVPKRAPEVARLEAEATFLAAVGPRLPIPVPAPVIERIDDPRLPGPVSRHRYLPGVPALVLDPPADRAAAAASMGALLSELHSFPVKDAIRAGLAPDPEGPIPAWQAEMRTALPRIETVLPPDLFERCRAALADDSLLPPPMPGDPVPVHADIGPEHILLDPKTGAITGLIDWADACLGDPAGDLAGLANWMGPEFLAEVLFNYRGGDSGIARRAAYRGLLAGLANADYGVISGRTEYLRPGHALIEANLNAVTAP